MGIRLARRRFPGRFDVLAAGVVARCALAFFRRTPALYSVRAIHRLPIIEALVPGHPTIVRRDDSLVALGVLVGRLG